MKNESGRATRAARFLGRRGGAATKGISTPAKTAAARRNAKLGGRLIWMDTDELWQVGDIGFLAEVLEENNAVKYYSLDHQPNRKNMSGEPCLEGWCGTSNNVNITARGLAQVVRVVDGYSPDDTHRVGVRRITDPATIIEFLEHSGYPDLAD
jgi:hypothetical protein